MSHHPNILFLNNCHARTPNSDSKPGKCHVRSFCCCHALVIGTEVFGQKAPRVHVLFPPQFTTSAFLVLVNPSSVLFEESEADPSTATNRALVFPPLCMYVWLCVFLYVCLSRAPTMYLHTFQLTVGRLSDTSLTRGRLSETTIALTEASNTDAETSVTDAGGSVTTVDTLTAPTPHNSRTAERGSVWHPDPIPGPNTDPDPFNGTTLRYD